MQRYTATIKALQWETTSGRKSVFLVIQGDKWVK